MLKILDPKEAYLADTYYIDLAETSNNLQKAKGLLV